MSMWHVVRAPPLPRHCISWYSVVQGFTAGMMKCLRSSSLPVPEVPGRHRHEPGFTPSLFLLCSTLVFISPLLSSIKPSRLSPFTLSPLLVLFSFAHPLPLTHIRYSILIYTLSLLVWQHHSPSFGLRLELRQPLKLRHLTIHWLVG
ncbi:hypothetical protein J3F84DRAFT_144811 [Trichoderma pleuroticola]